MVSQNIPFDVLTRALAACLTFSCIFVCLRSGARWIKTWEIPVATEDLFMYLGLATNIAMSGLYLDLLPRLRRILLVETGQLAPYATMDIDMVIGLKEVFCSLIIFWSTLWCVKMSLLFMFKKLTTGISLYTKIWWGVLVFSVLSFLGCVISAFESCSSIHAWFSTLERCETSRDITAKAASLWYALAVDILTDLMIMAIPIQILYTLRISTAQKFSAGVIFMVGLITMIVATVRAISLDSSVKDGNVSPTLLILFAAIETTTALIVGSLPSFVVLIRSRVEASRTSYSDTSISAPSSSRPKAQMRTESIVLEDVEPTLSRFSSDEGSSKNLVGRTIDVAHVWTQKRQLTTARKA